MNLSPLPLPAARRALAALGLALLLSGCASRPERPIPERISAPPAGDLQLVEARRDPQTYVGAAVRWGGHVVAVERDDAGNARVQVLERRLDDSGRPMPGSPSDGRFLIFATPDVDPGLYARGAEITVAGTLQAPVSASIAQRPEQLPVVRVEAFALWEPRWYPDPYHDHWPYHGYGHPWYGPRVHFGIGISHLRHHHPFGHRW